MLGNICWEWFNCQPQIQTNFFRQNTCEKVIKTILFFKEMPIFSKCYLNIKVENIPLELDIEV